MCVIFASFQECVVANCYYIQFSRFNVPPIGINANYDPFRNKMSKFLPSFLPSLIYHHLYIIVIQECLLMILILHLRLRPFVNWIDLENHDLENINQRLIANKLFVNLTKTEYTIIAFDNSLSDIIQYPKFYT